MKKSIVRVLTVTCCVALLNQPLSVLASGQGQNQPIDKSSVATTPDPADIPPQANPDVTPPKPMPETDRQDDGGPNIPATVTWEMYAGVYEGIYNYEREQIIARRMSDSEYADPPILEYWHVQIPDNSTPADYGLSSPSWSAYELDHVTNGSLKLPLFGQYQNEIGITDDDTSTYRAKVREKLALLPSDFQLTADLNNLVLVMADGSHFPRTKYNPNKQFTGTMRAMPYDGNTHRIYITEQYTVQPGDTLGQIILDCGWLPQDDTLWGANGYLVRYALQQGVDYSQPLMPGDILSWRSEEIVVIDNLYPNIKIDIIPGSIFSAGTPADW